MVPAVNDTLFSLEPAADAPHPVPEEERAPVAKTFRPYDPHQILLLPPSLESGCRSGTWPLRERVGGGGVQGVRTIRLLTVHERQTMLRHAKVVAAGYCRPGT